MVGKRFTDALRAIPLFPGRRVRGYGGLVFAGRARRFALLSVLLVAAYFATAPFFYDSPAVDVVAGWIAVAGGAILTAAGTAAYVTGAIIRTDHGAAPAG